MTWPHFSLCVALYDITSSSVFLFHHSKAKRRTHTLAHTKSVINIDISLRQLRTARFLRILHPPAPPSSPKQAQTQTNKHTKTNTRSQLHTGKQTEDAIERIYSGESDTRLQIAAVTKRRLSCSCQRGTQIKTKQQQKNTACAPNKCWRWTAEHWHSNNRRDASSGRTLTRVCRGLALQGHCSSCLCPAKQAIRG